MSIYAQWNPNTTYVVGDIVEFAGFNYIAAAVSQNVSPFPTNASWTLLPSGGGGGGGGGVSTIAAGNSNIVIGGTATNPIISGTLTALTSNVATSNFSFSGNTSTPSFVVGAGQNFRVITVDLSPQIVVGATGVELGEAGSGYTVRCNNVPAAGDNSTKVATTSFVHRSQVNTLNFFKPLFPSLVKQSIIYHNASTTITAATIDAQLDALPDHPQYISYGATHPNLYVIVGEGTTDQIAVSTDGINYQGLGLIFGTTAGNFGAGVAYSGSLNRWVAVGRGNPTIVYSTTGYNWTNVVSSTTIIAEGTSVFWNGTRFFAGGIGAPNTIAYSDNGTTWVGVGTSTFTTRCNGFATNGEIIVAVGIGTNHIAYSYDGGLTWTGLGAIISNAGGTSVVWTGNRFIATFDDSTGIGNTVAYSFNGIDWVGQGMIFAPYGYGSASNNTLQAVAGSSPGGGAVSISFNGGDSWNSVSSAGLDGIGFAIAWSGFLWIAVGSGLSNVVYSSDGNTWFNAVQPIDLSVRGIAFNYDRSHRITFPVNRIVACGSGGNSLAYSNNGGRTWKNLNTVLQTSANGIEVISVPPEFGNYIYVAVGQGTSPAHSVAISNDGVNWRKGANPLLTGNDVVYGNRWVMCGSGPRQIAHSNDAITWTAQTNTLFTNARGLAYNGTNMWVCVGSGSGNTIANSTTGTSFVGQGSTVFTSGGRGVVWGTDKFVAVGSGGTSIAWSSDGLIWNPVAGSSALGAFQAVAYNGSLFLAGGLNGVGTTNLASSPDGVAWTGLATVNFNSVLGVAWVGDKWVITGSGTFSGIANRIAYSTNVAGTEWVYLGNQQFATTGQSAVWNGSLGTPVVPASSIVLNSTNNKKLDIVPAPYGNGGYNNITMTVKT